MQQQVAEEMARRVFRRRGLAAQAAAPLLGLRIDRREPRARGLRRRAAGTERGQRLPARGDVVTAQALERITGFDQRGEVAGQRDLGRITRCQQHRREARVRAQGEHALAEGGDAATRIERAEALQQVDARGQGAARRRIDEAQVGFAPRGEFEREAGKFDLRNFSASIGFEALRFRPQPVAPALGHATGATGALVGAGLGDGHGVEPRETRVRLEARFAREAAVDHHAHAGQRDAGFGHVRRQHHAALAVRVGVQRGGLRLHRQLAVQRQQAHVGGDDRLQHAHRLGDLALARYEHQQVAGMLGQRMFHAAA